MLKTEIKSYDKQLTPREIQIARDWLKDCTGCFENIQSVEDVDDFSDDEITNGINKEFNGLDNFRNEICIYYATN